MKNAKTRIISILLAAAMLCSLAACGSENTDPSAETSATTAMAEETQAEEETSLLSTEAAVLRMGTLIANKKDFEVLEDMARLIMLSSHEGCYDSSSDTAFMDAMFMIRNNGVDMSDGIYGMESGKDCFGYYDEELSKFVFDPDPLNKFADIEDAAGYTKIEADYVDWVLENVLCVTPDRTKTSDDFDYSSYANAEEYYYYDGCYYYSLHEGGGGGGPLTVIGYDYNEDGSYTVKFTTFEREREDEYDVHNGLYYGYALLEVRASLKEVDGKRVWAVSYLKELESTDGIWHRNQSAEEN